MNVDGRDHDRHTKKLKAAQNEDVESQAQEVSQEALAIDKVEKVPKMPIVEPLSAEQLKRLRQVFQMNCKPKLAQQEALGRELGCTAFQINQIMRDWRGELHRKRRQQEAKTLAATRS